MKDISQKTVRSLLDYNPETGILKWKKRNLSLFPTKRHALTWNTKNVGKRAGSISINKKTGYKHRKIAIFGKRYIEHRIIWLIMKGHPVPDEIDHINQDATDNRWSNMRASNHSLNGRNSTKKSTNTSGITGVYWHKRAGKWLAYCTLDGKYNYLGLHADIKDAERAVKQFRKDNGFYDAHGANPAPYR